MYLCAELEIRLQRNHPTALFGRALFAYVSDQLRENGYSNIYLWVLEENRRARRCYEKMGFWASGDRIVQNIGGKDCAEIRYVNKR